MLESKPEYLRAMSLQKIAAYINKNPMDVNRLTEEQITKLITSSLNYEPNFKFLRYLPLKKQEEYITLRGTVTYLRNNLDKFAEEAVVNVAEKDEERFKSGANSLLRRSSSTRPWALSYRSHFPSRKM